MLQKRQENGYTYRVKQTLHKLSERRKVGRFARHPLEVNERPEVIF